MMVWWASVAAAVDPAEIHVGIEIISEHLKYRVLQGWMKMVSSA
jgi:hypothetical protein